MNANFITPVTEALVARHNPKLHRSGASVMELLNADLPDCDVQGQPLPSLAAYSLAAYKARAHILRIRFSDFGLGRPVVTVM
jgi:hypothetical protein